MSDAPEVDLFGAPVAAPAPPKVARPAKAPARRPTIVHEPEPTRPPPPPIPMGAAPGAPTIDRPPVMPRYATRLLETYEACSCCGKQADVAVKVRREHRPDERLALCRACRSVGRETAPARAEGALAGPWVCAWLREAGMIDFEPKRGSL